jgi:hypothetical protein
MEKQHMHVNTGKHNQTTPASKPSDNHPRQSTRKLLTVLLWLPITAIAATPTKPAVEPAASANPNIHFSQSKVPGAELQLEVKQATLTDVIEQIATKTNVVIHYSVLPEAPISATCIAGKVQQLMECLVGKQIGVMAHKGDSGKDEVWLLGSSVGGCSASSTAANATPAEIAPVPLTPEQQAEADRSRLEYTQSLLQQTKSKNPNERMIAFSNLGDPSNDNPGIDQALNQALSDKDSNVRIQAVATIAQRRGDDMVEQLTQAMQDKDPNIRISVVSFAGADSGLLQQALGDSDPTVRGMAQTRIAEMERQLAKQAQ